MWDDRVTAVGTLPLRVLVVGAGMAVGYGVDDGAPSLARRLADALRDETGRGAIVQMRAQTSVRLDRTIDFIGLVGAATYDVVIWSPTLEEIFHGGSRRWRRELRTIVRHLQATGPAHLRVLLMGVPAAQGAHLLQRSGDVLSRGVNRSIAQVASGFDRVEHVPVPPRLVDARDTLLFDRAYQDVVVAELATLIGARLRVPEAPGVMRRRDAGAPPR